MYIRVLIILILFVPFCQSYGQMEIKEHYVLVGARIEVSNITDKIDVLGDSWLKGKYKVVQNVYGNYSKDTIEFLASFHCGANLFLKSEHVLMFLIKNNNGTFLQKYQYFDVYRTVDGRWASPASPGKFKNDDTVHTKPYPIAFMDSIWYDTRQTDRGCMRKVVYAEPYFKVEGYKAFALMGAYVDDLFLMKRELLNRAF
jgi:hypothetical protein